MPTGHPGLLMATPRTADPAIVGRALDEIAAACRAGACGDGARACWAGWCPSSSRTTPRGPPHKEENSLNAPLPFLDLKAQQARMAASLRPRLEAVLAHCQFILGPEVAELEGAAGRLLRRAALRGRELRDGCAADRHDGRGDRTRRRGVPAGVHLYGDCRGAAAARGDAGVRRRRPADIPDRSGASRGSGSPTVRAAGRLRPRALIGVDLFGQPADWPALNAIAAQEGLFTIDDLAQSFGASLHGAKLGTQAQATATSFFPSKPLGAYGDGGALFTDERRARRAVSQPADAWRRNQSLRGAADRNERPARHVAGGGAAGQARRVRR